MKLLDVKAAGFLSLSGLLLLSACGADAELEILGSWKSNYEALEKIDATSWTSTSSGFTTTYSMVKFDNEANMVITQNASDASYDPDKFNKIVWTDIVEDTFYYCMVDYSQETAELAETSTVSADVSDPGNSGCGGFTWTKLTTHVE